MPRGEPREFPTRIVVVSILVAAMAGASWRYWPEPWRTAGVLFHQWRQMTYRLPADKVVFEEDDAAAKALAASDGRYKTQAFLSAPRRAAPNGTPRTLVAGNGPPLIWDDPLAPERGPEWDSFGTVFMHGLTSKGGTRRLVHIGLSVSDPPGASTIVSFRIMSNPPVTWDNLAGTEHAVPGTFYGPGHGSAFETLRGAGRSGGPIAVHDSIRSGAAEGNDRRAVAG